jgi:hypothetical protein
MTTNIDQWSKYTLMQRSEQKSRRKTNAKRSSRKREHSLNDKSENKSVLGNKKRIHLLPKKFVGVQPFIASNKTKEN